MHGVSLGWASQRRLNLSTRARSDAAEMPHRLSRNPDGRANAQVYDRRMSKIPRWIDILAFAIALSLALASALASSMQK
jgi:hypothetical protein